MSDRAAVRLSLLHMLPDFLERRGVSPHRVFSCAGLGDWVIHDPMKLVTRAQICAALEASARLLGDPTVGLNCVEGAVPTQLGLTGRALLSGRTLRDCLEAQARFMPSLQTATTFNLEVVGEEAIWRHVLVGSDADTIRILYEGIVAFMVDAIRRLVGNSWAPNAIEFSHRPPPRIQCYEERFRAPVSFGLGKGIAIRFPAAQLSWPVIGGRPLWRGDDGKAVSNELESLRTQVDEFHISDDQLMQSLDNIVESMIFLGKVSLPAAARTLGFSTRNLQRRIAKLGSSFEEISDCRRRALAIEFLADRRFRTTDIAMALGYSDSAHFIRAFQRWTSQSPSVFRANLSPAADRAVPQYPAPS